MPVEQQEKRIAVVNGSVGGKTGNTEVMIRRAERVLGELGVYAVGICLEEDRQVAEVMEVLTNADGFLFATGTYWDSWGSPLQQFLEQSTRWEGSAVWMGKPAAVMVSMHSVGGKEVLSRLQGVLVTLGCSIPPMGGIAYSFANHQALLTEPTSLHDDLWRMEDIDVVCHNLAEAVRGGKDWRGWGVDGKDSGALWIEERV